MLPKKHRLNLEKEINFVRKFGRRISSPFFVLSCVVNPKDQRIRFGFLVSKKVSNKTTDRNLVKRRLRQIVANNLSACSPGVACVLSARPESLTADYEALQTAVLTSFKTLGILKNN
jgi:ribonuclease P protein component